jgi:hypothetical protein
VSCRRSWHRDRRERTILARERVVTLARRAHCASGRSTGRAIFDTPRGFVVESLEFFRFPIFRPLRHRLTLIFPLRFRSIPINNIILAA